MNLHGEKIFEEGYGDEEMNLDHPGLSLTKSILVRGRQKDQT
jgi:hypothetical protein